MKRIRLPGTDTLFFLLIFLLSFVFYSPLNGFDASSGALGGAPFTDTSDLMEMPGEWVNRPLAYDSWAKGADLALALDQHLYPALLPHIKNFEKEKGLVIKVKEGTCGISQGMLMKKMVDMAGFCCPPGKTDRLPNLKFHTLGIASLALFVHPDNSITNMTLKEARDIYRGRIYHWSELNEGNKSFKDGGINILPVGRLHCKSRPGHWCLLLKEESLFSPALQEVGSIQDMISLVASSRKSIGYETLWMAERYKSEGEVKALQIDGFSPYETTPLIENKYPLYRTYNITTWDRGNPNALALKDYLLNSVDKIDKRYGIIPVNLLKGKGWKFQGEELTGEPE